MKRFFILIFLCGIVFCANAQKKYVMFSVNLGGIDNIILSGEIPPTMKYVCSHDDFGGDRWEYGIGKLLNKLADYGFTVEQMNTASGVNSSGNLKSKTYFLLSKPSSDSDSADATPNVRANTGAEITEVARYNLQGMPVKVNDKGLQIVVYSNYTTKTVIVE